MWTAVQRPKKLMVQPLIKVWLVLNKNLEVFGIYDSDSNVCAINSRLLKFKDKSSITTILI